MSIRILSNEPTAPGTPAVVETQTTSAPEAKATEQNTESTESDTEETEATESNSEEAEQEAESTDDDAEGKATEEDAKPKKKGGFQRRIDKLNQRMSAAQQEAEYWRALALKNGAAEPAKSEQPAKSEAKTTQEVGKPNPESFDTHAEYVEALTDWKLEQREAKSKEEARKHELMSKQEQLVSSYMEKSKAFAEKVEDFQEALESVDDIVASPAVQSLILESENGPELAYELAKNRKEFERINSLSPLAAAREMGKIEARLAKAATAEEKKPEPKKITKAPQPIAPVGSKGGKASKSIWDADLTQREYEELRRAQSRS